MSLLDCPFFRDEAAAYAKVESILGPNGPACRHCGERDRVGLMGGKSTRPGLYKCYACRKQFRVTVGTVFEGSHVPLHQWLQAIFLMVSSKKGISSHQIARTMDVTVKTAWFMTHRIREAMKSDQSGRLGGEGLTVEADETYVGGEAENRAYEAPKPKQAIMALVERGGAVRSFHVPNVTANNLRPIIGRHVHADSRFQSDESPIYTHIGWNFEHHGAVNHGRKEYMKGDDNTNTVEGYFSILKRGIYGVYQHVSEAHLQRYLAEFDFRYTYRMKTGFNDMARFDRALAGVVGKRLTYRSANGAGAA